MKKFTSLSFMLIAALMMFASCSKDDDGAPALDLKLLEGEWTVTKTVSTINGEEMFADDSEAVFTFNSDKTYTEVSSFTEVEGTYAVSGRSITLTSKGGEVNKYEITELTENSLTFFNSLEESFMGISVKTTTTINFSKGQ